MSESGANSQHQLLQCLQAQVSELDLLLSMYPNQSELAIDDCAAVDELRRLVAECENDAAKLLESCHWRIGFTFRISVKESASRVVECVCRLPGTYPALKPPGLFLRSDWLSRERLRLVSEALANEMESVFTPGEPLLYQVLSWLSDFVCTNVYVSEELSTSALCSTATASPKTGAVSPNLCRLWIHSHHIYNSLKRRDILNWSHELRLTGFSIVGKPGVVCVEGAESAAEEFWQRLRRLNWKKLTLKEKDTCSPDCSTKEREQFCRFVDFRELSFNARPGRGREVLQDWGLVIRFLEDRGLGHVIPLYFGNLTAK